MLRRLASLARYALSDLRDDSVAASLSVLLFAVVALPSAAFLVVDAMVVEAWTDAIAQDAHNREIDVRTRADFSYFSPVDIAAIANWRETGFVAPQASFAITGELWAAPEPDGSIPARGRFRDIATLATASSDPHLADGLVPYGFSEVALSDAAARMLGISLDDTVVLMAVRKMGGRTERAFHRARVVALADPSLQPRAAVYVSIRLAAALRAFRARSLQPSAFPSGLKGEQGWPGLRVYARTIHDVEALAARLEALGVSEARFERGRILRLKAIQTGMQAAFAGIVVVSAIGFACALFFVEVLNARRKAADMGLLVLIGFSRRDIAALRVMQTAGLSALGAALALIATAAAEGALGDSARRLMGGLEEGAFPAIGAACGVAGAMVFGAAGAVCQTLASTAAGLRAAIRKD